jgi:hypothetical protein
MRTMGKWLGGLLGVLLLYCFSIGPIAVLAFQNRPKLGKSWAVYRIYIEPVVLSPTPIENLAVSYMKSWCKITKTEFPGDYTLD